MNATTKRPDIKYGLNPSSMAKLHGIFREIIYNSIEYNTDNNISFYVRRKLDIYICTPIHANCSLNIRNDNVIQLKQN